MIDHSFDADYMAICTILMALVLLGGAIGAVIIDLWRWISDKRRSNRNTTE